MFYFIVNPKSRSGYGAKLWNYVHQTLLLRKLDYQVFFTRYRGHAAKLAQNLTGSGWKQDDTLVILGGDGTLNEAASGICKRSAVIMGYIPTGSGNDFARSMGIPSDAAAALNRILKPSEMKRIDLGTSRYASGNSHFVTSAGIGFDAAICHEAAVSPLKGLLNRLKMGKMIYTLIALKQLFFHRSFSLMVELDHQRKLLYRNVYFAAVMNQRYEGGGLKFCPEARPDDGLLDIMILSDISRLKILFLLPTAFFGKHTHIRGVHILRCQTAKLTADIPLPIHKDGEPDGIRNMLEVSLEPLALNIITE